MQLQRHNASRVSPRVTAFVSLCVWCCLVLSDGAVFVCASDLCHAKHCARTFTHTNVFVRTPGEDTTLAEKKQQKTAR